MIGDRAIYRRDMSQHNVVSAQNHAEEVVAPIHSNVMYKLCVEQSVMSFPAISLGDWFSVNRNRGEWVVYAPKE